MFKKKKKFLFRYKDLNEKERYCVCRAECEADAVWKFINNHRILLKLKSEFDYEVIGAIDLF